MSEKDIVVPKGMNWDEAVAAQPKSKPKADPKPDPKPDETKKEN